jgi:hypothetical protein
MTRRHTPAWRSGISAAALYAGAVALVVVPSAGFALGAVDGGDLRAGIASFTPASIDPRLAELVGTQRGNDLMRFTPAGAVSRQGRSVTVAVRVDGGVTEALAVRTVLSGGNEQQLDSAVAPVAPTRFNLGVARGYQSFAKAPTLQRDLSDAAIPDLASFRPSPGVKEKPSRFAARLAVEEEPGASRARSAEAVVDQTYDLGGSYRVTRNLDVTAGVRYSQDRDRIAPLTTNGKQDSQAVYVGTQFRF